MFNSSKLGVSLKCELNISCLYLPFHMLINNNNNIYIAIPNWLILV